MKLSICRSRLWLSQYRFEVVLWYHQHLQIIFTMKNYHRVIPQRPKPKSLMTPILLWEAIWEIILGKLEGTQRSGELIEKNHLSFWFRWRWLESGSNSTNLWNFHKVANPKFGANFKWMKQNKRFHSLA